MEVEPGLGEIREALRWKMLGCFQTKSWVMNPDTAACCPVVSHSLPSHSSVMASMPHCFHPFFVQGHGITVVPPAVSSGSTGTLSPLAPSHLRHFLVPLEHCRYLHPEARTGLPSSYLACLGTHLALSHLWTQQNQCCLCAHALHSAPIAAPNVSLGSDAPAEAAP